MIMKRPWYPALAALLIALLLAGCTLNNTPEATPAPLGEATPPPSAAPLPSAEATAEEPTAEATSAATTVITGTPAISPGPIFQPGQLQSESIIINATGELQPATISATAGMTLALTLVNRNEADALLTFDLAPGGSATILVPGLLATSGGSPDETATPEPQPTARLFLSPTAGPISPTTTLEAPTAGQATPTALIGTPVISGSIEVFYVRYDQPGVYYVRCIADASGLPGGQSACAGSITITVAAASGAPGSTPTPEPIGGTAVATSTSALTGTTTLTATSAASPASATEAATSTSSAATAQATSAATAQATSAATPQATGTP